MKSRSREVNIFNMSLLDVLSGALGAFCFLMLVLFPSYKNKAATAGGDPAAVQDELRHTQEELRQAREQMSGMVKGQPVDVQQTLARLQHAEDARAQAESRARQAESRAQQAQASAQAAQKAYQDAAQRADLAKSPMMVQAMWSSPGDEVNVFVRYNGKTSEGKFAPEFDPKTRPKPFFRGDTIFNWSGTEMWLIRDTPPGEYEVYYRVARRADPRQPLSVRALYASDDSIAFLPQTTLEPGRDAAFIGKIVRTQEHKLEFQPAGGGKK